MIKVIKYGRRIIECSQCGTVYSFESEDIDVEEITLSGYSNGYILCPVCSKKERVEL